MVNVCWTRPVIGGYRYVLIVSFRVLVVAARALRAFQVLLLLVAGLALHAAPAHAQCVPPNKLGVVFVVDDSGSMTSNDPSDLRGDGVRVGLEYVPDGSVAAAVRFDSSADVLFGPTVVDGATRGGLGNAVRLTSSGGTDFDDAFIAAKEQLDAMPADVDRKAVIFLSDGIHEDGVFDRTDEQIAAAGIPIDTIGFGDGEPAVLRDIAEGGGRTGRYYEVSDAGATQTAFADLVGRLICTPVTVGQQAELAPGEVREFPFTVSPSDRGWNALVSWNDGDFEVDAVRPDGSVFADGALLRDETFRRGAKRRELSARYPQQGGWRVRVSASAQNAGRVKVDIRVYGRNDGGTTVGVGFPERDVPWMIPSQPKLKWLRALKGMRGVPLHLFLQPTVGVSGRVSAGMAVPEDLAEGEPRAYKVVNPANPLGSPWTFSVEDYSWKGEGVGRPQGLGVQGPGIAVGRPGISNPMPGLSGFFGQVIRVPLGQAFGVSYTQDFPLPTPLQASLTVTGRGKIQAGAFVSELAAWAAIRCAAILGASVPSGGAGGAAIAGIVAAQAVAQSAYEAAVIANYVARVYQIAIRTQDLVEAMSGTLSAIMVEVLPRIRSAVRDIIKEQVRRATRAVVTVIRSGFKLGSRVVGAITGRTRSGAAAVAAQKQLDSLALFRKSRTLRTRRATKRFRLHQRWIRRSRTRQAMRVLNRYAPMNPVRLRRLATSRRSLRGSRWITVGARLGGGRAHVLTLTGPNGYVRERLVDARGGVSAARLQLPNRLRSGRWRIALTNYAPSRRSRNAKIVMAAAEFDIRRKKTKKTKKP